MSCSRAVRARVEKAVPAATRYLAVVVSDGARPTTNMKAPRELKEATGVDLRIESTVRGRKAVDLRAVLRGCDALEHRIGCGPRISRVSAASLGATTTDTLVSEEEQRREVAETRRKPTGVNLFGALERRSI